MIRPGISHALGLMGLVVVTGCTGLSVDPNNPDESLFSLLGSKRSPQDLVVDAQNPFDADKRHQGTLGLSMQDFGGETAYVAIYAENAEDADASVRAAACRALGRHGRPEHGAILVKGLRDKNGAVRRECARSLQRIHAPEAIDPLLAALREPDAAVNTPGEEEADVRAEAALALGQYAERRVIQGLIGALGDPRLAVNRNTLVALRVLTGQDLGYDRRAWLAWLGESKDPFLARGVFVYPAYSRSKDWLEYFPFMPQPPNEEPTTPVGLPLAPKTP